MQLRRIIDSVVSRFWIGLQWVLRLEFTRELLALYVVGLLVAGIVCFLLLIPYVKNIDRYATDTLMNYAAWQPPRQGSTDGVPPVFFINVGEASCRKWANIKHTSCALGWTTPRDHLINILNKLIEYVEDGSVPRLVVIDIELAPLPSEDKQDNTDASKETDASKKRQLDQVLCSGVLKLTHNVPLIALRPMVIMDRESSVYKQYKTPVNSFGSILDDPACGGSNSVGDPRNLWFASAIIQADTDGVVRQVHAWDTQYYEPIQKPEIQKPELIAGIGLLGAAIVGFQHQAQVERFLADMRERMAAFGLMSRWEKPWVISAMFKLYPDQATLACLFPGSMPGQKSCLPPIPFPIWFGDGKYKPELDGSWREFHRIRFSLPYVQPDEQPGRDPKPDVSSMIHTVEAEKFEAKDPNYPTQLHNSVVVIGGSYLASGDLRITPLGPGMPGAVVHANAIRAYYTNELIEEDHSVKVELILIGIAAVIGALFHVISSRGTDAQCILGSCIGVVVVAILVIGGFQAKALGMLVGIVLAAFTSIFIPRILVSLVGVAVAALLVLWFGVRLAYPILVAGTAIGTLTPALAVAFEGLFNVLHSIKELVARCVDWVAPSSRPPDRMTIDAVVAIAVIDEPPPPSGK